MPPVRVLPEVLLQTQVLKAASEALVEREPLQGASQLTLRVHTQRARAAVREQLASKGRRKGAYAQINK